MSNKNLDKVLNSTNLYNDDKSPDSNPPKRSEVKSNNHQQNNNYQQNTNVTRNLKSFDEEILFFDDERTNKQYMNNNNNQDLYESNVNRIRSSKINITKNIGKIFDIPNDAIIQTIGSNKIFDKKFKVKIIGIGGAGNNIVKYVYNSRTWPDFVELIALNTDYIALKNIPELVGNLYLIGADELNGNGSGGDPEMGRRACDSDADKIKSMLEGTDILVLVAGLGKGTGTGATPVIAEIAKSLGILTIGLFNLPSIGAEGTKTYSNALAGLDKLSYVCSGLTTISNDRIIGNDRERTSIKKAYQDANEYIRIIIDEFINIITKGSEVNIDFTDIKNFFNDQNGFLFVKVEITDYTKDAIKEAIEEKIQTGYTDIDISESTNAIFNFKINENVPSVILENARSALKEIIKTSDLNIVHGISFSDKHENAEINMLLAGKFEHNRVINNNDNDFFKNKYQFTDNIFANQESNDNIIFNQTESEEIIKNDCPEEDQVTPIYNTEKIEPENIVTIEPEINVFSSSDIVENEPFSISSDDDSLKLRTNKINDDEIIKHKRKSFFQKIKGAFSKEDKK